MIPADQSPDGNVPGRTQPRSRLGTEAPQWHNNYSQAFQRFVTEPDDIVGLLAYGFFKASIRERAVQGQAIAPALRNPTDTDIDAYRGRAERTLEQYGALLIADATPEIEDSARSSASALITEEINKVGNQISTDVRDNKNLIIESVKARTNFWIGLLSGVVAWIISLIVTIIIAFSQPEWVQALVSHTTGR